MYSLLLRLLPVRIFAALASAQTFDGPGLHGGVDQASEIDGPLQEDVRSIVLTLLYNVLGFLALAATVMIIVAGISLIFSASSDTGKERAKKIIIYTAIGLIVIMLARSGVGMVLYGLF